MNEITLSVDSRHLAVLLSFLKTLNYVEIKKVAEGRASPVSNGERIALLNSLYGAWKDHRSAESIIMDIATTRVFNRNVESL